MLFFFAKTENYSIFAEEKLHSAIWKQAFIARLHFFCKRLSEQDIIYPDSLEQVIGFYEVQDILFEHLFIYTSKQNHNEYEMDSNHPAWFYREWGNLHK